MITNCKINCMGTVDFDGKFNGMRKAQDFIVYPMQDSGSLITIQSDTRIGVINLETGEVKMSQSHASGAYGVHLSSDTLIRSVVPQEDLMTLRGWINKSGGVEVGKLHVICDNTGALSV